jgi:hypothetical protein
VLWLPLPRLPTDPEGIVGRVGHGSMLLLADRDELWQLGMIIPKGATLDWTVCTARSSSWSPGSPIG